MCRGGGGYNIDGGGGLTRVMESYKWNCLLTIETGSSRIAAFSVFPLPHASGPTRVDTSGPTRADTYPKLD